MKITNYQLPITPSHPAFFTRPLLWAVLAFAFALGLGIRLYDLTDPPFDFHPTRQWRAAIIARGMYYQNLEGVPGWQREQAVAQWKKEAVIEPPVMEWLTAWGYRLAGGEHLWIARLLASLFWTLGGVAVFLLARELGQTDGGVLAVLYFLFLPYGMIASRAFQPDPLMTALIAVSLWAMVRWHNRRTLAAAALAGLFAGLAVFVKTVAVFFVGGALAGLVLFGSGIENRESSQSLLSTLQSLIANTQLWLLFALSALPAAAYYVYGLWIDGFLRQQFKYRFFPEMWRDPAFYIRWVEMASDIVGYAAMLAALIGVFLLRERALRAMAAGLWAGYAAYSLAFPFQAITHDYYQEPLILVVAAGLIPVGEVLLRGVARLNNGALPKLVVIAVILFGVLFKVWDTRVILARKDYRPAAAEWAQYRDIIPPDARVIAITKAYGYPLAYYGWIDSALWLSESDAQLRELAGMSEEQIRQKRFAALEGKDLFLITNFNEFEKQPELREFLFENYEIYAEGNGYLIFDLNAPK